MLTKATEYDVDFIDLLEQSLFSSDVRVDRKQILKSMENKKHTILVYQEFGKKIGYVHYVTNEKTIRLYVIAVHKKFQHRGYGSKMLEYVIEVSKSLQKPISLEVDADKGWLVSFYQNYDFKVKEILPDYYGEDTTCFRMIRKV